MQRIDSLKFEFSNQLALFDAKNFNKKIDIIEDVEYTKYILKPKLLRTGINEIYINDAKCIISISSKLKPELYYDMININSVKDYFSEINNTGLIQFDVNSVIENSKVLSCDVTNNIPNIIDVPTYINPLIIYKVNDKYNCKLYRNQSIVFTKDIKEKKYGEQLKFYGKYQELTSSKKRQSKEFLNNIDVEIFKNVLRVESRFSSFKTLRKGFNISDLNLISVLNSQEKINLNIFNRITDINNIDAETIRIYKSIIEMRENKISRASIEKKIGMIQICKMLNNDIKLIRMFINTGSTANNSAKVKEYKSLLESINNVENNISIDERVNEIKEYLKVA